MASDGAKLVRAARAGDDAKVKRLLKAKVDVDHVEGSIYGITALRTACFNGHVGAARVLLKAKATVDLQSSGARCFALYDACQEGRPDCAQLLLEAKATVDLEVIDSGTPLTKAAEMGHLFMM